MSRDKMRKSSILCCMENLLISKGEVRKLTLVPRFLSLLAACVLVSSNTVEVAHKIWRGWWMRRVRDPRDLSTTIPAS
jgi:hypothetical protein